MSDPETETRRDVVVLGWWAREQNRIRFVEILREELGIGLAEAKQRLDASLETGQLILLPTPSPRAEALAASIAALGAEVRVLSGQHEASAAARDELHRLEQALADFFSQTFATRDERAEAASRLCAGLSIPGTTPVEDRPGPLRSTR